MLFPPGEIEKLCGVHSAHLGAGKVAAKVFEVDNARSHLIQHSHAAPGAADQDHHGARLPAAFLWQA